MRANLKAFTLVELSIVLVIIGLIVGGVLTGSTLINQSRLIKDVKTLRTIVAATTTFREKYTAYPGNMATAYNFFGDSCGTNDSGAQGSCNGCGSGIINYCGGVTPSGADAPFEDLTFWLHLNLSGFYQNAMTGFPDKTVRSVLGVNVPKGSRPSAAMGVFGVPMPLGIIPPANYLSYGKVDSVALNASGALLAPSDASYIDIKYDDGMPMQGDMLGFQGQPNTLGPCITSDTPPTYDQTDTTFSCLMIFRIP